jgi:pyruvate dehydrogenase E2 component (dihydrolipoyllysine-residue acetyltransferase)
MSELGVAGSGVKGEVTTRELERFERTVARRSAEIRATVPSIELTAVVCVDGALASDVSLDALVIEAAAVALRAVPRANGSYRDGQYEMYSRVNIGVVVADEEGTYAIPTVFDADTKSAAELEAELADYSERALGGDLASAEQTGATFTVSLSPGDAVTTVAPLIMAPQAAALAVGAVQLTPVVRDGSVVAGQTIAVALSCDHRILFAVHGAALLEAFKRHLESV